MQLDWQRAANPVQLSGQSFAQLHCCASSYCASWNLVVMLLNESEKPVRVVRFRACVTRIDTMIKENIIRRHLNLLLHCQSVGYLHCQSVG